MKEKFTTIYVACSRFRHYESDGEEYGDWSATNDYVFSGLYSSSELADNNHIHLPLLGEPKIGEDYYFVYADYRSGDSFGMESNLIEEIGLYRTLEEAESVKSLIEKDYKDNREKITKLEDRYGFPINTSTWKGYFEGLESVNIGKLTYIK